MKNFYNKIINSNWFYLPLVILSTAAIFWRPLTTKGLLFYADMSAPILNSAGFSRISNYLYVEQYFNLIQNPLYITFYFILQKIYYQISLLVSQELLSVLWVMLPYLFNSLVAYGLFGLFVNNKRIVFLQTIIFIFSFYYFNSFFSGGSSTIWSIAGGLAMFGLVIKYLEEPRFKYLVLAASASLFGTMNIAFFYCAILATIFYILIFCFFKKLPWRELIRQYRPLVWLLVIGLFLQTFWLLPYLLAYLHYQINFGGPTNVIFLASRSCIDPLNNFNFGRVFQRTPLYLPIFTWYNLPWYKLLTMFALSVVFYWALFKNKKNRLTLSWIFLYLLLFSFTLGAGFILSDLFSHIPGWFFLRNITRFYYLFWFLLVLLIGQVLVRETKKTWRYFFVAYAIINMAVFFHSDLFKFFSKTSLPEDYQQIVQYLSTAQRQNQGVVILPEVYEGNNYYTWIKNGFYNIPLFDNLLVNPIVEPYWGRGRVPEYFFPFLDNKVDKNNYAKYLGRADIKYIITGHDLPDCYSRYYNRELNIGNFDNAKYLSKVIDGPNVKLYEIDDSQYYPVIYADSPVTYQKINPAKYLVKLKINQSTKLVFNQPFNADIKIFPQKFDADDNCLVINHFQKVQAKECEPQNIFFQEDDLTYLWRQAAFVDTHKQDYNYANTWFISPAEIKKNIDKQYYRENPDGSIDIELVLYFKPQSYFYIGLFISGMTLLGCLGYLGYDWRKRKNERKLVEVMKSIS